MAREFELVLPCYNESKSLPSLTRRTVEAAKECGYDEKSFQLVLVENGSRDDSLNVMNGLKASKWGGWFRIVSLKVNQGYGYGLWKGLSSSKASYVGWSHADQQCDPADAFRALSIVKAGGKKTFVKGFRSGRNWKDIAVTRTFETIALCFLGLTVQEINAQPKVFSRSLLEELHYPPYHFAFDLYVLYRAKKAGYDIQTIPVLFPPRVDGVSNWAHSLAGRRKAILGMIRYMGGLALMEGRA